MPTSTVSILFPSSTNDPSIISDLHLDSHAAILPIDAQFHFLSYVDPALLLLYLAAGPSLDVWTDNDSTARWLEDVLLRGHDDESEGDEADGDEGRAWWSAQHAQSRVGILVQVQSDVVEKGGGGAPALPRITEMLIYGSVTDGDTRRMNAGLTSPAGSVLGSGMREKRVLALPLSSDLLYRGGGDEKFDSQGRFTPLSPASDGFGSGSPAAYFLRPLFSESQTTSLSARKRQRVVNLLDDAVLRHKKARRKGGDAIGRTIGSIEGVLSQSQQRPEPRSTTPRTMTEIEKGDDLGLGKDDSQYRRPSLEYRQSRSPSVASFQIAGPGRPASRKGLLVESKRSSLHRVDSIVAANDGSPVPEQEKTIEQRNKDALSRIIMAGMRLYGLQQRRKSCKSRAASEVPSQGTTTPDIIAKGSAEEVDEYKLIYHQTFKGAAFALRREIATSLISQAVMRDVADKLLAIFSSDPSTELGGAPVQGFDQERRGAIVPSRRPVVEPG